MLALTLLENILLVICIALLLYLLIAGPRFPEDRGSPKT